MCKISQNVKETGRVTTSNSTRPHPTIHSDRRKGKTLAMMRSLFRSKAVHRCRWEDSDGLIQSLHQYAIIANQWYVPSKSTCLNFDIEPFWCCFGPSFFCMLCMWLVLFTTFFSFSQLANAYNMTRQSKAIMMILCQQTGNQMEEPTSPKIQNTAWICKIGRVDTASYWIVASKKSL